MNTCYSGKLPGQIDTIQALIATMQFPERYKTPEHFILTRQEGLVNFLVGFNRFFKWGLLHLFNDLVSGASHLCGQLGPNYSLAERVLLLAVTILLNIPSKFVKGQFEKPIRRELYKVSLSQQFKYCVCHVME